MEGFQDQLRSSISAVLGSLSPDQVNNAVATLYDVGVESLSDLEFVREEDLRTLNPIQKRKLVKSWTAQSKSLDEPDFHTPQKEKSRKLNNPQRKNKWPIELRLKLLKVFSECKTQNYCPEKVHIWQDISSEMKKEFSLDVDFIQCYKKIVTLMHTFLRFKGNGVTTKRAVRVYKEMQNAFEIPGDPGCLNMVDSLLEQLFLLTATKSLGDCQSLGKIKWKRGKNVKLLQIFSRHKMQICSHTYGESLWESIANEMNRSCSLNFGPEVYRIKVLGLINTYTNLMTDRRISAKQAVIYAEMQKALNMVVDDANGAVASDDLISSSLSQILKKE